LPGLQIIHMDISSSNVLVDAGWNAKISDVGMSKMVLGDNMQNTMVSTPPPFHPRPTTKQPTNNQPNNQTG
jgi:serine/threonine protein kinase